MTNSPTKESTSPNPGPKIRRLKIEEDGDPWKGKVRSKIRLKGCWLEQAGFKHGGYVHIQCAAPGILELRSGDAAPSNALYQPVYLGLRDDVDPGQCLFSQLKYKADETE